VTPDPAKAAMAKAYFDFELGKKKPVLTGITYRSSTENGDKRTDHWVLMVERSGDTYTYNDPANGTRAQLTWDKQKFWRPNPKHPQFMEVVSWVRPNDGADLDEWTTYWAQQDQGSGAAPDAAAAAKTG